MQNNDIALVALAVAALGLVSSIVLTVLSILGV